MVSKPKYKVVEEKPILFCTDQRFRKLNWIGFKTLGHKESLSAILDMNGFSTPYRFEDQGQTYYKFQIHAPNVVTHTGMYLTEVDSLAEAIILLRKLKLI